MNKDASIDNDADHETVDPTKDDLINTKDEVTEAFRQSRPADEAEAETLEVDDITGDD